MINYFKIFFILILLSAKLSAYSSSFTTQEYSIYNTFANLDLYLVTGTHQTTEFYSLTNTNYNIIVNYNKKVFDNNIFCNRYLTSKIFKVYKQHFFRLIDYPISLIVSRLIFPFQYFW